MMTNKIEEPQIRAVLERFYASVRRDALLAPAFAVVTDWNEHLDRLADFWSSLMLTSGRYKGNPVALHLVHAASIRPEMFVRWLDLWAEATTCLLPTDLAAEMQTKARKVASRLSFALHGPSPEANALPSRSALPYRITPEFDEENIPAPLLCEHSLKAGTWGVLRVREGLIHFVKGSDRANPSHHDPQTPAIISPETPHHLELVGPVKFHIEFYNVPPQEGETERKSHA